MSASSRRQKELQRLARRLRSPRPDLPILRTAERTQTQALAAPTPHPASPALTTPPSPLADPSAPSLQAPDPQPPDSILPAWTRILPLPPGLSPEFRSWLFRYIEDTIAPADSTEHYLAARIAQAIARQHLSAAREPLQPNALWLRYETLATREHRAAVRALQAHRAARRAAPPQTPTSTDAQTSPSPHNPNFVIPTAPAHAPEASSPPSLPRPTDTLPEPADNLSPQANNPPPIAAQPQPLETATPSSPGSPTFTAAPSPQRQTVPMGDAGFEPATSCVSSMRSSQLS
ncbi:MAG: hypothetical protein KatS3mg108_3083 [Isosphaeraceae bacterium]|nr:MAG: hypothetical protein KatS3mg108_3083 [Isosphaeraceae bacterium]